MAEVVVVMCSGVVAVVVAAVIMNIKKRGPYLY